MFINVIGLGYIGLPTALMFASHRIKVVGTDVNEELVAKLKKKTLTFEEKGLDQLFNKAQDNIEFTTTYQKTNIYIIAVPTPYNKDSKKVDPSYVQIAIRNVLDICKPGSIIIIESTIPPGTVDKYLRYLTKNKDVHLVHAPERIIPGNMVYELINNSRTIGSDKPLIGEKVKKLYSSFCKGKIITTDIRTAEMTKVVENTYRDINIAFANELAKICRSDNMDVYEIIKLANMHPRVNILSPGPGVGGHCISVDPWFLVGDYPGLANIILTARKINDSMPAFVLNRINKIMKKEGISNPNKVGIYGLTYKENIDDIRESPTIQLFNLMEKHLAGPLKVYDPWVNYKLYESQYFDFDKFLMDIELLVIITAHDHIKENIDKIKNKIIFDTKNILKIDKAYKL